MPALPHPASLLRSLLPLLLFHPGTSPAQDSFVLFDDRDLSAFTSWLRDTKRDDPRAVFSVVDGAIRISGDGYGYLATKRSFRHYQLTLEYRWGDQHGLARGERAGKALDSGVFLHATGPDGNSHDGNGAYMAAIECNIFEGATGDILLIRGTAEDGSLLAPRVTVAADGRRDAGGFPTWTEGGAPATLTRWGRVNWLHKAGNWSDTRGFRGPQDPEHPPGQWNTLQCTCRDDTITITLNGKTVNQVTQVSPREGKILLQCEGAEIFYRKIRVTPPPDPAAK